VRVADIKESKIPQPLPHAANKTAVLSGYLVSNNKKTPAITSYFNSKNIFVKRINLEKDVESVNKTMYL